MKYLLDTNACIVAMRDATCCVAVRLWDESPQHVVLCSVVRAELLYGAYKSQNPEKTLQNLMLFLECFQSLPFDDAASEYYGKLRADLSKRGQLIGPNDLMIAAIAMAHDLVLVSHNTKEFSRIDTLRLEDWQ